MKGLFGLSEVKVEYSPWKLIKDLGRLVSPYRWRFFFGSMFRLFSDLIWLYPPFAFATIVTFLTNYSAGVDLRPLVMVLVLWGLVVVFHSLFRFLAKQLGFRVAERVAIDATLETLKHLFLLDMRWHEKENSGNKIKRIQNGAQGLDKILRIWFNNLIEIVVNFVGIIFIFALLDQTILWLLIVFMFAYFAVSFVLTRRAAAASYMVNQEEEQVSGLMFEAINNIRSVKVMAIAGELYDIAVQRTQTLFEKIKLRIFRFQLRSSTLNLLGQGFRFGILAFIVFGILEGHYEVGFLVLFNGYFNNIWGSVDELSEVTQEFVAARFSISRMKEITKAPLGIDDERGRMALSRDWQKITLEHVSFSYGDSAVLRDVSFEINRGEKVGIVGLSGAGKSTLFKLLLKERDEFKGEIRFDNISIKNLSRKDYFRHVSTVLQDTEVFNLSLRENITITNTDTKSGELLEQALEIAHVKDFLEKLPEGIETVVGEKGVKLSGGERQRLGIARAIYRQPELLLMDEATSHLDLESEEKIRDSLHQLFEKVTAVVIAHRLTTIKEMDKILVLEGGRLIESGNFVELMEKKGRFFELWEKQKL